MDEAVLVFFRQNPQALPLYEKLEQLILTEIEDVRIKVQKSQISFYHKHLFACVSFAKVRKAEKRPDVWMTVTLGLNRRLDSPRVDAASEPYPGRWTHHILISAAEQLDGELMAWVKEAAGFAAAKGRTVRNRP